MSETPQSRMVAGTWWAGLSREQFYQIVHAKQDELRRDARFGQDIPRGKNNPGKPPGTTFKVSDGVPVRKCR